MEPVSLLVAASGEWSVVHRCQACKAEQVHTIAADDDGALLLTIGARSSSRRWRRSAETPAGV